MEESLPLRRVESTLLWGSCNHAVSAHNGVPMQTTRDAPWVRIKAGAVYKAESTIVTFHSLIAYGCP